MGIDQEALDFWSLSREQTCIWKFEFLFQNNFFYKTNCITKRYIGEQRYFSVCEMMIYTSHPPNNEMKRGGEEGRAVILNNWMWDKLPQCSYMVYFQTYPSNQMVP